MLPSTRRGNFDRHIGLLERRHYSLTALLILKDNWETMLVTCKGGRNMSATWPYRRQRLDLNDVGSRSTQQRCRVAAVLFTLGCPIVRSDRFNCSFHAGQQVFVVTRQMTVNVLIAK